MIGGVRLEDGELEIYDLCGKTVRLNSSYFDGKWHVKGLPSGLYSFRVGGKSGKLLVEAR